MAEEQPKQQSPPDTKEETVDTKDVEVNLESKLAGFDPAVIPDLLEQQMYDVQIMPQLEAYVVYQVCIVFVR
jgi:uncharacterized protein YjaG (DUF416 family)